MTARRSLTGARGVATVATTEEAKVSPSPSRAYRIHPLCAWRRIDDRVFILNDADAFVTLDDPVGLVVWQRLEQGPCDVGALLAAVTDAFDVPADEARRDLDEFLEALTVGRAVEPA